MCLVRSLHPLPTLRVALRGVGGSLGGSLGDPLLASSWNVRGLRRDLAPILPTFPPSADPPPILARRSCPQSPYHLGRDRGATGRRIGGGIGHGGQMVHAPGYFFRARLGVSELGLGVKCARDEGRRAVGLPSLAPNYPHT